jgi:hypothetical protein
VDSRQDELGGVTHEAGCVGGAGELVDVTAGASGKDEFPHQTGRLNAFAVVDIGQALTVAGTTLGDVRGDDPVARVEHLQQGEQRV